MRLKRGVERESCDFCHGRKIKCDKPARSREGIDTCSACERRDIACLVDDSTDIRLQKRRVNTERRTQSSFENQSPSLALLSPPTATTQSLAVDASASTAAVPFAAQEPQDLLFDLNAESAFFLDQIFMGNLAGDWASDTYTGLAMDASAPSALVSRPDTVAGIDHYRNLWHDCQLQSEIFMLALRFYFDYAALALPIVIEDAFWTDVQSNVVSEVLVCAVACRGMPFVKDNDRWLFQQRLASKFKQLFLQKQQDAPSDTTLDDIEALALMVNFPYAPDTVSGLERLFLSKDALVLMTLQSGPVTEICQLSRASERHTLLFWHVYGLDAFSCLDSKTASRIPETEPLPAIKGTNSGYLDAVFSLALVARDILQKLCGSTRHGVRYSDIKSLYSQLEFWTASSCPPHLRQFNEADEESSSPYIHVQRAVLHLLRINCYMQIESWAEEHGVCVETMADQMTAPRIEYESLQALHEGTEIAQWLKDRHVGEFPVVDTAPSILRDINAGLGVWTCLRSLRELPRTTYRIRNNDENARKVHIETAMLFRTNIALAASHCDTASVLSRFDEQMDALKRSLS